MNNYQIPYYKEQERVDPDESFEEYASETFFPDYLYEMLHRTQDSKMNKKRFIRSSLILIFILRSGMNPAKIFGSSVNTWRLIRSMRRSVSSTTIFCIVLRHWKIHFFSFVLKIQREEYYFFVPFNQIRSTELYFSFLNSYIVSVDRPISTELIGKYLRTWKIL
ncbi:MAG: hypothetical protein WDM78_19485 [Puia sp.]